MPALHDSVTICNTCDLYVATSEMDTCIECSKAICPTCGNPSSKDRYLRVCSARCEALFAARIKREAAIEVGYSCEAPGCDRVCLREVPFMLHGLKVCGQCALIAEVIPQRGRR